MMFKLLVLSLMLIPANASECGPKAPSDAKLLEQLMKHIQKNSNKRSIKPEVLAPAIIRASKAYGVDAMLISRVLATESHYNPNAFNKHSHDYGIAQLNKRTLIRHKISMECATNWICNLNTGVYLLSKFQSLYSASESLWYCRYNVGTGSMSSLGPLCNAYNQKLIATK